MGESSPKKSLILVESWLLRDILLLYSREGIMRRKKRMPIGAKIIIFAVVLGCVYGVWLFAGVFVADKVLEQETIWPEVSLEVPFGYVVSISEIENTRYLELVNREFGLAVEPDRSLLVDAWPDLPVRARYITLHISARNAVGELFDAARADNSIGTFFVSSGYRDFNTQQQLYNSGMDRNFVLPPGHSEHHTGLAVDILAVDIGQFELAHTAEGRWLTDNAYRFGLILRYPENKQDITGIAYEPWHFRYVGQPHAWFMWQNALVLEEYLEFLRQTGGYTIAFDGREYTVLWQTPIDGTLTIPQNANFSISSDNTGGFVITSFTD